MKKSKCDRLKLAKRLFKVTYGSTHKSFDFLWEDAEEFSRNEYLALADVAIAYVKEQETKSGHRK